MDQRTINLNQTYAECLKHTNDFTQTVVTNVCTGAQYTIHQGSIDRLFIILALSFMAVVVAFIARAAFCE